MTVSVFDIGFIHGITVSEQVRTFAGKPFLLDQHFERWQRGLQLLSMTTPIDLCALETVVFQLIEANSRLLAHDCEQGVCFFALPGSSTNIWANCGKQLSDRDAANLKSMAEIFAYTYPLPHAQHSQLYNTGVSLITSSILDVPDKCWPKDVKIRSRLHYYLAQQQCPQLGCYPILLDLPGHVSDSSIGSIAAWSRTDGLVVRPASDRYDSISLEYLCGLVEQLGFPVTQRYIDQGELTEFEELFLLSTPWCIYPVRDVDNQTLAATARGFPMFQQLMRTWEQSVGCRFIPNTVG